jgi:hypothetical protein
VAGCAGPPPRFQTALRFASRDFVQLDEPRALVHLAAAYINFPESVLLTKIIS